MRKVTPEIAMEESTWFHLNNNMSMAMTYNLRRINEAFKEHVDNNFRPLPQEYHDTFKFLCNKIKQVIISAETALRENRPDLIDDLRRQCNEIKDELSQNVRNVYDLLHKEDTQNISVTYVYLNALQEGQEFVTSLRKLLRAAGKLNLDPSTYRSFTQTSQKSTDKPEVKKEISGKDTINLKYGLS